MSEPRKCSKCGRSDVVLATLQANRDKPSKPFCIKCLQNLSRDLRQRLKQLAKRGGA